MALIAGDNLRPLTSTRHELAVFFGQRWALSWTCVRRARCAESCSKPLERLRLTLSIQPVDASHAMIESWLESDGVRQRTLQPPVTRTCAMSFVDGMFNVDMQGADGGRLLSLSIEIQAQRVVYAQSALLEQGGFVGGTYDQPALHGAGDERIAQSA